MFVSDLPAWVIRASAFVFGALWGSFFNVAIYRWPRDMSVVSPPSHCPHCQAPVPAWRNFPIVGYLLLRGRTACCGERLTPRYVLVELSAAALCMALAERFMVSAEPSATLAATGVETLLFFAFVGGLIIATFVDLEWMEIPDEVSIGGAALGLATVLLREHGPDVADLAIGAGGGYLLVQLVLVFSWERLTGRRGMGEGDAKLMLFIGAFLGWRGALFALVAAAFQGIVVTAIVMASGRRIGASVDAPDDEAGGDETKPAEPAETAETAETAERERAEASTQSLQLADGTTATLSEEATRLEVADGHGRLLWEYLTISSEDQSLLRRAIPFGPFLALGALEFLFFGEWLIERYLRLFE